MLNRKRTRDLMKHSSSREKVEADQRKSTMCDVCKNHHKQIVTAISECELVMSIVYIVFSSSCCKKTIGNALGSMAHAVVRALALRSGDPGFKTRSDHSLNLFLVVPGATSQLHM